MRIRLTFKMPDVLDQVDEQIDDDDVRAAVKTLARRFLEYDEYVYLELDTEKETMTVVKP